MNTRVLSLFYITLVFVVPFINAGCYGPVVYGSPNLYPINEGFGSATFVSQTQNGKLYTVTVPNDGGNTTQQFYLVHVWGSAYEMGFAQGTLQKAIANDFISSVWTYLESEIDNVIPWFPTWLQNWIADFGLDAALDLTYYLTIEYTPQHFYDEMRGLCDASGADYDTMVRVHMIAGLTQGACSMFGAWGDALDPNYKLLQLRALDWNMDGPFRDYSQITIYHPSEGNQFANVGMPGFIGGLTGLSEQLLGISEIGVGYPDSTFGSQSRVGYPFIFLLRDILQFDYTIDDAINRMINAHRTCNLLLGVGDGKENEFRGMEYSYSVLDVMDDENLRPTNVSWHPRITDVVYWGMDWDCPAYNTILSQQFEQYYGKITPEIAISYFTAVEQSGDNHLAYYDFTNGFLYVAFAAPFNVGGPVGAYARQFTKFNITTFWNEKPPTL